MLSNSQNHKVRLEFSPFLLALGVFLCGIAFVAVTKTSSHYGACVCAPCTCCNAVCWDQNTGAIGSIGKAEQCPGGHCPVVTPFVVPNFVPAKPSVPSSSAPAASAVDRLYEKKTGQWACVSCNRSLVGSAMHTTYADGEAITFLCQECWARKSPTERMNDFNRWITKQPPSSDAKVSAARSAVGSDR